MVGAAANRDDPIAKQVARLASKPSVALCRSKARREPVSDVMTTTRTARESLARALTRSSPTRHPAAAMDARGADRAGDGGADENRAHRAAHAPRRRGAEQRAHGARAAPAADDAHAAVASGDGSRRLVARPRAQAVVDGAAGRSPQARPVRRCDPRGRPRVAPAGRRAGAPPPGFAANAAPPPPRLLRSRSKCRRRPPRHSRTPGPPARTPRRRLRRPRRYSPSRTTRRK